ncbi:hydroxyethylthiazole kinase [Carnobacterium sp.]|uniref:hydroxyethylthiazole kinase n=1 Tax=Carnobacterium sp. TaxID=48221 RepID=UPI003C78E0E8
MSKIYGTGCMLSTIIGAYCGANKDNLFEATTLAVAHMGLAGEIALEKLAQIEGGIASYKLFLIDSLSKINYQILKEGIKLKIEKETLLLYAVTDRSWIGVKKIEEALKARVTFLQVREKN